MTIPVVVQPFQMRALCLSGMSAQSKGHGRSGPLPTSPLEYLLGGPQPVPLSGKRPILLVASDESFGVSDCVLQPLLQLLLGCVRQDW